MTVQSGWTATLREREVAHADLDRAFPPPTRKRPSEMT